MATLIANYKASASSGSTFSDVVGGYDMTLQGGATFNSNYNGLPAMVCTNVGDFARLATTPSAIQSLTLPISIAVKFYIATVTGAPKLYSTGDWRPSDIYAGVAMQYASSLGAVLVSYGDGGAGGGNDRRSAQTPNSVISASTWTTVLGVARGAADFTIYVDSGSGCASSTPLGYSGTGGALNNGVGPSDSGGGASSTDSQQLFGGISEIWLFDGEATCQDIATPTSSIYNSRRYIPDTRLRIRP